MRILIVEDDLEAAEAMVRGLSDGGHACTQAADGEEGLAAARAGDLVSVSFEPPGLEDVFIELVSQ